MLPKRHFDLIEKEAADMLKSSTDSIDMLFPLLKDGKAKAEKVSKINDNSIINSSKSSDDDYYIDDDNYYDYDDEIVNATTTTTTTTKSPTSSGECFLV